MTERESPVDKLFATIWNMPYTKMLLGYRPDHEEVRRGVKHCGLARKQWEKKKRERKNRKKARKGR